MQRADAWGSSRWQWPQNKRRRARRKKDPETEDWPQEASEIRFPPGTWLEAGQAKAPQSFQEDLEAATPNPTVSQRVPRLDCWDSHSRPGTFIDVQLWAPTLIFLHLCHQ